jgi:hypothetical protein
VCLCLFKCLPLFSFVGPFGGHWIQSKFKNPNEVSNCLTPVFHPNDIIGAILLLWAEIMSSRGQFVVGGGWMEHLHPPTRSQFYRLLVFITSKDSAKLSPNPKHVCSYKIHHKRRQQRQRWLAGWVGLPKKGVMTRLLAQAQMSSVPPVSLPCIRIHQRP